MSHALGLDFGTNNVPALIEARLRRPRHHRTPQRIRRPIRRVVCCGGIAEKNGLLLQIYADVTGRARQVAASY